MANQVRYQNTKDNRTTHSVPSPIMGFAEASQILSDFGPYKGQDEDMDLDDQMNGDTVMTLELTHDETQRDSMGTPPIREVTIDGAG